MVTMRLLPTTLLLAATGLGLATEPLLSTGPDPIQQRGARGQQRKKQEDTRPPGVTRPSNRIRPTDEKDQDEPGGRTGPRRAAPLDVFGRTRRTQSRALEDQILGGWILTDLSIPGSDSTGRLTQGFLNIGTDVISLEVHATWSEQAGGPTAPNFHTSFTAEYEMLPGQRMHCSTILGSFYDPEVGTLQWERAGFRREYRIGIVGDELIFVFNGRQGTEGRMKFKPHFGSGAGERDIFGRRITSGARSNQVDIFGRPKEQSASGQPDIFGRTQPQQRGAVNLPPPEPGQRPDEEGGSSGGGEDGRR